MKYAILPFIFIINAYACFPICNWESATPAQNQKFMKLIDTNSSAILNKIGEISQTQDKLKTALQAKIKVLTKIRNVLKEILLMKKEENFYLENIIKIKTMEHNDGKLVYK